MHASDEPRGSSGANPERAHEPAPGRPVDLLLVDNDRAIGDLIAWVLVRAGYVVRTATSFAEARLRLGERRPDLMLSDVDLGAESALVELPRLASIGALPPTLVVSGYLDADKRSQLGALPTVVGFLDKPFDPRALQERVAEALVVAAQLPSSALRGPAPGWSADADAVVASEDLDDGWIEIGGGS
ncbi:MAG: response regulator [Planctomycetota bacterium]